MVNCATAWLTFLCSILPSLMAVSVRNLGVPLLLFSAFQICLFSTGAVDMINYLNLAALIGMLVFLFIHTKLKGRFHKRVFSALFISVIGITYFAIQHNRYLDLFPSMLFFLLPKLFFISAFYLDFRSAPELDKRGARIAIGISFLMSLGYYLAIRAHLGILKLPVMIGIFTSSLMFMMACFRNLRVNSRSFWTILAGVLLYIFAEGLLAYHSFAQPILGMDLIYAISLVMGLYLLVLGTVSRTLLHSQVD
jgi:hypothetical protein